MKTLILTFAASILLAGISLAEEKKDPTKELSTAETEFITQCEELIKKCQENIAYEKTCSPEVVIINEENICFMAGDSEDLHIKRLKLESDYLTEVHGTSFYKINRHAPSIGIDEAYTFLK